MLSPSSTGYRVRCSTLRRSWSADASEAGTSIALDLGVDTSTPSGEMMAIVLATFAQFERRLIGQRTRDALAVKRAHGVRLGRPREMSADIVERIGELYEAGLSVAAIARKLNEENVPRHEADGGTAPASSAPSHGFAREERKQLRVDSDGPTVLAPASGDRAAC